jgi:NTE family protein
LAAVQVGMLRELLHAGVKPDFVVGSSIGAMNAAYFAGARSAKVYLSPQSEESRFSA